MLVIALPIFAADANRQSKHSGAEQYVQEYGYYMCISTMILSYFASLVKSLAALYRQISKKRKKNAQNGQNAQNGRGGKTPQQPVTQNGRGGKTPQQPVAGRNNNSSIRAMMTQRRTYSVPAAPRPAYLR
ncbi:unnamed protein product [Didymodactylos carnosus]|nr:unnamed protein product [Didymodactylos carnosus]CAF4362865.1 unnamed protein product [Didymodactylos carnosus]